MNPVSIGLVVFACVFGSSLVAMLVRRLLPKHHLSPSANDTVKLAMGLVATMAALVLGLLVASAKGSYDTEKSEVTSVAAKIAFLDRMLAMYGPESAEARQSLKHAVEHMIARIWSNSVPQTSMMDPHASTAEGVYRAIQKLSPQNDDQRGLKAQALSSMFDIAQMRFLLFEQAGSSISTPLLIVVVCWLAVLFISFGLFAPANGTVIVALMVAALSIAGAIFLVLELDQPFGGVIQISDRPMTNTLHHIGE